VVNESQTTTRYDPKTDTWAPGSSDGQPLIGSSGTVIAWTGERLLVVGNAESAAYVPDRDGWEPVVQEAPPPSYGSTDRGLLSGAWSGQYLLVWGGFIPFGRSSDPWYGDGLAYDPASTRWIPLPDAPLNPTSGPAMIWTGEELIVWGRQTSDSGAPSSRLSTSAPWGARFRPDPASPRP